MSPPDAVRERQAPLRAAYRDRPQDAVTSKSGRTSASHVPAADPFHGEVEIGRGYGVSLRYGLDKSIGGLHDAPNPGDMLCAALAACQDGTIRMIANLLGVQLEDLGVEVTGQLDLRGALGVDPDVRVGFETLDCRVRLRTAAATESAAVERLVAAAEHFCVNADTLRSGVVIRLDVESPSDRR